ncbi:PE family protein [Mycobacterium uberis]|uniref:PE family protein n=1 Tax=Mycobacterium uberis TaxID=2162698 RepID=UPI001FB5380B|nr:PE family protein [Mycobacterium uberis]
MSFVIAVPDLVAAAATDLHEIGTSLSEANAATAAQVTGVLSAGVYEVSAAIAALFSGYGQSYIKRSARR